MALSSAIRSTTGIEFRFGVEEQGAATGAAITPRFFLVPILAAERRLGAFLARDAVLLRREHGFPFGVGLIYLVGHDSVSSDGWKCCESVAEHWSPAAALRSVRNATNEYVTMTRVTRGSTISVREA